jgi:hypothetical protein
METLDKMGTFIIIMGATKEVAAIIIIKMGWVIREDTKIQ